MVTAIIGGIAGAIFFIILIIVFIKSIKVVAQTEFAIIERLGKYNKTLKQGVNFMLPFVDKIVLKDNLKEKVLDFPAQDVITKDNATIKVDTVVYMQITDPKLFAYGAEYPIKAIENLSATTLRNLLGELELDETLTSRDTINTKLTTILDSASDAWGIKVHRVELKNILPPVDIQNAMEKQMRAEREKRAKILDAEGFKGAAILKAQGEKEAAILKAQGEKESAILEAEGKRQAIELLNSSNITNKVLTLKSIEQLGVLADGKATKIIIPPNLKDVATQMSLVSELFDKKDAEYKK